MDSSGSNQDTVRYENGGQTLKLSSEQDKKVGESGTLFVQLGGKEYKFFKPLLTSKEDWTKRLDVIRKTQEDFNRPRPQHIPQEKWDKLQEQRQKGLGMVANALKDPLYMGSESRRGYALLMDVQFQERQLGGDLQAAKEISDRSFSEFRRQDEEELRALEPLYEEKRKRVLELKTQKEQKENTLRQNEQKLAEIPGRQREALNRLNSVLQEINGKSTDAVDARGNRVREPGLQAKYQEAQGNAKATTESIQKRERGHVRRWERVYRKEFPDETLDLETSSANDRLNQLKQLEQIWIQRERKAFLIKGRARRSLELIREQIRQTQAEIDAKGALDAAINVLNAVRSNQATIDRDEKDIRATIHKISSEMPLAETQFRSAENDMLTTYSQIQERRQRLRRADQLQNQRQSS